MKIVHIGTADTDGGAAKASYALHKSLLALGHDSRMVVGYKYSNDAEIDSVWFNRGKIRRRLHQLFIGKAEEITGLQSLIQPFRSVFLRHPFVRGADIIHLHNLHGNFFSHTILPKLSALAPLVWTIYDMWPMTGHCTYPGMYDCEKWKTGEDKCPALFDYPPIQRDTVAYLAKRKKEAYAMSKPHFVGPSKWMCETAKKSLLLGNFDVSYIAQGIDTDIYHKEDKKTARKELGLPLDAQVIMVIALRNASRKGLSYVLDSLQYLKRHPRPLIFAVGSRGLVEPFVADFPVKEIDYINSERLLNTCFVASDIFVLPTLADNLPLTILDSLGAGTPVVSFDVNGVHEIVRHMETGYLARYKDPRDLACGIDLLLQDDDLRNKMSQCAQQMIISEYSIRQQAMNYVRLYEQRIVSRRSIQN